MLDTIGAASFAFLTADAIAHRNETDSAAPIWIDPFAMAALAFASSAVYGYIMPGRCERSVRSSTR